MDLTRTAFGTWSGGRFMHYGQPLEEDRWVALAQWAHAKGTKTFVTADVYGNGQADALLGKALAGLARESYCLVGAVGHDFYTGKRDGSKGYPRFTHPDLRRPQDFADYLLMATEKSLERCGVSQFDYLLLHNPDSAGYTQDAVWNGMQRLVDDGLARKLGVAPGPANGFTLDVLLCFERFGPLIDAAMIILNPFEPWPGGLVLPAADKFEVDIITRVVDYGGIFHDDVRPGHRFGQSDHRSFRPGGWVEEGNRKLELLRPIAEKHGLTMLQLAAAWCLQQPSVKCVAPTLIQEVSSDAKSIEAKAAELAATPEARLSDEELGAVAGIGDNKGCMHLKGGNRTHTAPPVADQWPLNPDLEAVGRRYGIDPDRDLACSHSE
jgi:aryl-alcohol dehydrogenase-like predicted oxidoreductase